MRDLAGTIIAARRTYETAISVRAAINSGGDAKALRGEVDAHFENLAAALGYQVTRDDEASMMEVS